MSNVERDTILSGRGERSVHSLGNSPAIFIPTFCRTIRVNALGNGVSMDAQDLGSVRNTLPITRKCLLNVKLFEFLQGLVEQDVSVEHGVDHSFELWPDLHFL